ncbi:hypothetical protein B0H14DRAFT_2587230 [Mycena olivaceomarginata]|nr:hypothetical protein B0H14DRAFT_2587230 [Mycena olivaceomarginata]
MANYFSPIYAIPRPSNFPLWTRRTSPHRRPEQLTAHPTVVAAINLRIVAAAGQMAATAQVPFLTFCDAGMGYHLPSCLRVLEAAHVVEVLRDGPVHVSEANRGKARWWIVHVFGITAFGFPLKADDTCSNQA